MSLRLLAAILSALLMAGAGHAQTLGDSDLNKAYEALAKKDYDSAIDFFRKGLASQTANAGAHKDLAYTLLKAGENEAARDEFEAALKVNPKDETAALEFAFLAFETKKAVEARRTFDKLRKTGNPSTKPIAEHAFQNIDKPLADGIARWKQALAQSDKPDDLTMFSAHWELAQLAELRDELPLAAGQYEICRKMKPQLGELLLILARVWRQTNRAEEAQAALIAASRSSESRTAEQALELLGKRYPYPYEFKAAIKIDPHNFAIRRELGYLYLAMNDKPKAIDEFQQILDLNPKDWQAREQLNNLRGLRTRVPQSAAEKTVVIEAKSGASPGVDARAMGLKSLELGYSNDAIKYLLLAHEQEPGDTEVMLKLGWAYNLAKNDKEAKIWFALARKSNNRITASEATRAFHVVNGDMAAQTTIWMLPMYSSRWKDLFSYGQIKRSVPVPFPGVSKFVSLYLSTRFIGDIKSSLIPLGAVDPLYLSESSVILGVGAATRTWHRLTGWLEAGEAFKYLPRNDIGAAIPDYRGGVNFAKGFGSLLGSPKSGFYYETTADTIYVSRFAKDWLFYSQNRTGRTFALENRASVQFLFNGNIVRDVKGEYWANTIEMGPGIKFHPSFLPRNVYFSTDFLRGVYLDNKYNPRKPNYNDVRLSFWYAITRK